MLTVEVRRNGELGALLTAWETNLGASPGEAGKTHCFECYQPGLRTVEGELTLLPAEGALGMARQLVHKALWTSGKAEVPLAAEDKVEHLINHIRDQVAKRQYLNATSWGVELVAELQRRLNDVLKGGG